MKKRKTSSLRAGIYARRTVNSEKSDSVQMQVEKCTQYLDMTRSGQIESITIYIDEGFSRRNTDRPDWQRMMQDVEDGLLDLIVVYRIDRVSGNMKDFTLFYSKIVDELEMQLISVREGIDSSLTLVGEAMAYLSAMMSTYEVKQDSIRSYDNSRNLAIHGFWFGGMPPVGYHAIPITVNGKVHKVLDIIPEDVAYKGKFVSIFLDNNLTLSGMQGFLKRAGIKTRNGKFFSTSQIYTILTAPQCVANTPEVYDFFEGLGCQMEQEYSSRDKWDGQHGILIFGRTTERKGKHTSTPPEDWLVCIGRHEPIMSGDTYLQIRKKLAEHTFVKDSTHPPELLRGVLRCKCGNLMRTSYKKKVDGSYSVWYFCHKRMLQGKEYCDAKHIKAHLLNNKVLEIFKEIKSDPSTVDLYVKKEERKEKYPPAATLKSRERVLEEKLERLASTLALNSESTATKYIIAEIERLDLELKECKKQLLLSAAEERRTNSDRKSLATKRQEIHALLENFDDFSMKEQNEIARTVLKECVWDGETLKIVL